MPNSYIKKIKEKTSGDIIYPESKTGAIYLPDNVTSLDSYLGNLDSYLGNTDISEIGDGTISGAIDLLNSNLGTSDISSIGDGTITGAIGLLNSKITEDTGRVQLNSHIWYQKKQGLVMIHITSNTSITLNRNGVYLATLPEGCRPASQYDFAGTSLGGTQVVFFRVEYNGDIKGFANPDSTYWDGVFCFFASH